MKDPEEKVNQLVAECYEKYRHPVFLYVYYKTGKKEESEDLTQDAFARLLEYRKMLCEETVKHFLFTIAIKQRGFLYPKIVSSFIFSKTHISSACNSTIFFPLLSLKLKYL